MKKHICFTIFLFILITKGYTQTNVIEKQAKGIAQFFSDSLHTSSVVTDSIYAINLLLGVQKMRAWETISKPDSLKLQLQQIENLRDVLYKPLLDSSRFTLYLKRKKEMLHAY
jgi:hypothetical protein